MPRGLMSKTTMYETMENLIKLTQLTSDPHYNIGNDAKTLRGIIGPFECKGLREGANIVGAIIPEYLGLRLRNRPSTEDFIEAPKNFVTSKKDIAIYDDPELEDNEIFIFTDKRMYVGSL